MRFPLGESSGMRLLERGNLRNVKNLRRMTRQVMIKSSYY